MIQVRTRSTPTVIAYFMQHMCNMCASAAGRVFFQSDCVPAPPRHCTRIRKKTNNKKCTVLCTLISIFLLITPLQSCYRLFPILHDNCTTGRLSDLEEGLRPNLIFSLMSQISWLLSFPFLASQIESPCKTFKWTSSIVPYSLLNDW